MYADIGGLGHQSDCQLYNNSSLAYGIKHGHLNLPPSEPLPNQTKPFPFFFLGDDAFALREHMLKPYSDKQLSMEQRIYNYRISRGRMVVENAFGILAQRWPSTQCLFGHADFNTENVFIRPISAHAPWRNLMESSTARRSEKLRRGRFTWAADFATNAPNIWRSRENAGNRRKPLKTAEVIFPCYSHPGGPYFTDRAGSYQNVG